MARATYVIRNGELVDKRFAEPLESPSQAPSVISDTMKAAAAHPCTGKVMDSKSAFRRVTREHGCIEIGNESTTPKTRYETPRGEIARELSRHFG